MITHKLAPIGILLSCLLVSLGCGCNAQDRGTPTKLIPARYVLPDIGFEIEAPDGFKLTQGTWYHPGLHATLDFAYARGKDYKAVASEFTPDAIKQTGKELIDRQEVDVSGTKGLLVQIAYESKGIKKTGWTVVFPDDDGVCQVGAIVRTNQGAEVLEAMSTAVLSVKRIKPTKKSGTPDK